MFDIYNMLQNLGTKSYKLPPPPKKKKSIISNFPNFLVVRTILRRVSQNFLIIHLWLKQPARVWNFGLGMSWPPLVLTVTPHHSHLMPAIHSDDQQVFLQATHLELAGRFPSLQWWYCTIFCCCKDKKEHPQLHLVFDHKD